jgi:hypothetical protein
MRVDFKNLRRIPSLLPNGRELFDDEEDEEAALGSVRRRRRR